MSQRLQTGAEYQLDLEGLHALSRSVLLNLKVPLDK